MTTVYDTFHTTGLRKNGLACNERLMLHDKAYSFAIGKTLFAIPSLV